MDVGELKAKFFALLREDVEFRYAVAGLLGFEEILRRMDKHEAELVKLREDMILGFKRHDEEIAKLREDMILGFKRHDEEIAKLREDMNRLREDMILGFKRHDEEIAKLREDMVAGFKRHDEILEKHAQEITKLREDMNRLREDTNKVFKRLDARLSRVERTLEKVTLDVEDEARIVIQYRLKEMGYDVKLAPLILPKVEINVYGVSDEVCIVGEATVRASSNVIDKINGDVEILRRIYPEKLKPRILKVVYTSLAMPDLVERAEKEGVWVLRATGDVVKPPKV
ncbi:MAG: hypothetical protein ACKD6O_06405 [Candidatus Bathyarchaeota archaeon]